MGRWESFDDIDGLIHNCSSLMEDRRGNLWIGSWVSGLSCYDGKKFVNFTKKDGLAGNEVRCIHQDRSRNIWVGTANGLSRYDGKKFVNFTDKDGLTGNYIRCIHQDKSGNIWVGTANGLSRYDGKKFVNFNKKEGLVGNDVRCIQQTRDGNIWLGIWRHGLSCYDGKRFFSFTQRDGLADNDVNCIHQDREGNIWVGTWNGLSRYDSQRFINFTQKDGLAGNNIYCIYQDKNGKIWIGFGFSPKGGVSCYDGSQFVNFNTEHGLAHNNVLDIIQDREGSFWFACHQGGISRYNPYEISYISYEAIDEVVIQDRNKSLWWGFENILSRFDGKEINHYPFENAIYELYEDRKGRLWIGTGGGGIFRYDSIKSLKDLKGQKLRNFTIDDGLANNYVWRIYEDIEGNVWIGTESGLSKYDGAKFINFTTDDGLGSNIISVIYQDKSGALWFAGWFGGGVSRYDGKSFHRYTIDDGLVNDRVVCLTEDDENNIWIGTDAGISCYNGSSFRSYTKEDGLLSNFIQRMIQDRRGQIWIATLGGGISRFDGRNFQVLTTEDGLPSNNVTGIIEDRKQETENRKQGKEDRGQGTGDREQENPRSDDGSYIISTYRGICRYMPDYKTPPLIQIDEIDADKIYKELKDIQLSESVKSIRIRYHGISFKTKRMRYNYILEGYDKDWKATWDEEVRYENLPIGEYTFKVIAINRDLVYSGKPAELRIRISSDPRDQVISELEQKVRERTRDLEEAYKDLSASEERFRSLAETARDAIVSADSHGNIVYFNQGAERIFGYSESDALGKPLTFLMPERFHGAHRQGLRRFLSTGETQVVGKTVEFVGKKKDGSEFPVEISLASWKTGDEIFFTAIIRDITERKLAEENMKNLAHRDFLTNLPNRRLFEDFFNLELAHAKRDKRMLAVMFLDLDKFKLINDTLGHKIGDQFLKNIAGQLTALLREGDTVARFGGDEFALLLPRINQIEDAAKVAQRIIESFKQPAKIGGHNFPITASIGISIYPKDGEDAETLLRNADTAMYCVKKRGKNDYQFYGFDTSLSSKS